MNRLNDESSPYLLLHADNPVDWFPWQGEALERARSEDKPIFLSVGYSTCYWCHVMERESFSDPAVAEKMNRDFVNIKVDREERPDIDEIYMTATQILNQQAGWPNSVFLTPELKPFFAGTYFPPEDRHGLPSFSTVLDSLASAWVERRSDVDEQAASVAAAMARALEHREDPLDRLPSVSLVNRSIDDLRSRFDPTWGGFGPAPKFPNPANLMLLLEVAKPGSDVAEMLTRTLEAMARGGIFDQVGGGFHRYSTDSEWLVPHFEKMLYDNGLLLEIYGRYLSAFTHPELARVVRRTVAFMSREMTDPSGGFWSAIDAETAGEEGAYYVWSEAELTSLLGREDSAFLAPILGFSAAPRFEGGRHILHLPSSLGEQADRRHLAFEGLESQLDSALERLLEARSKRDRPATDDKILADWNGMAIAGLAVAGGVLDEPKWIDMAAKAADFVLGNLRIESGLRHSWRGGKVGPAAFLSDYVFLVHGLVELARVDGGDRWLVAALELTHEQIERLGDPAGGFFVAAASEDVLFRSKEVVDGALPGANAVALLNLLDLNAATGDSAWMQTADKSLRTFGAFAERHAPAFRTFAVGVKRFHEAMGVEAQPGPGSISPRSELGETAPADVVKAELNLSPQPDSNRCRFRLHIDVKPGWYLYSPQSRSQNVGAVELAAVDLEITSLSYPVGELVEERTDGEEIYVYRSCFEIVGELQLGEEPRGSLRLAYQACTEDRCLAPAEIEVPIHA